MQSVGHVRDQKMMRQIISTIHIYMLQIFVFKQFMSMLNNKYVNFFVSLTLITSLTLVQKQA